MIISYMLFILYDHDLEFFDKDEKWFYLLLLIIANDIRPTATAATIPVAAIFLFIFFHTSFTR